MSALPRCGGGDLVKAPCLLEPSHVQCLPPRERRGLSEFVGRRLAMCAWQGVANELVDLLDVGRGLLVDRRPAEPAVHHADALRVPAQQFDEAAVEACQRESLDQLDPLRGGAGRQLDEAELDRGQAIRVADQVPVVAADRAVPVLPHRDAAREALVAHEWLHLAALRRRSEFADQLGLRPTALRACLRKPVAHLIPLCLRASTMPP